MGRPVLYHVIRRVQWAKRVSKIIVATTKKNEDRVLKKITNACSVSIFSGSSEDVLDRFYQTAKSFDLSNIVRITADSPVIDPDIIDSTIDKFCTDVYDYVSNCLTRTFPEGLSVEVFTFEALEKCWQESAWMSEREHVTPYIWKNPGVFKSAELLNNEGNQGHIRLTVDYPNDLKLIRKIYRNLFPLNPYFMMPDITKFLKKNPNLLNMNRNAPSIEWYRESLKNDHITKNI
jgi:spore coat polysaccharide biosynthesis protein SpsF (cytidylyltransferase family)